jgi:hypothetical protein
MRNSVRLEFCVPARAVLGHRSSQTFTVWNAPSPFEKRISQNSRVRAGPLHSMEE